MKNIIDMVRGKWRKSLSYLLVMIATMLAADAAFAEMKGASTPFSRKATGFTIARASP